MLFSLLVSWTEKFPLVFVVGLYDGYAAQPPELGIAVTFGNAYVVDKHASSKYVECMFSKCGLNGQALEAITDRVTSYVRE